MNYQNLSKNELTRLHKKLISEYNAICDKKLSLDMSRGKPSFAQVKISDDFFSLVGKKAGFKTLNGVDCRNYGLLDGIPELKKLFSEMLSVSENNVIVGGNSSLNMMYDVISQGMTTGFGEKPWLLQDEIIFLCPSPGYDRHFAICEHFGIKMIPIKNLSTGPDMDEIEKYMSDKRVKGIWCVPKFSNPEGITYSDETVKRFARLKPAANDFRIFWDNAYAVHCIDEDYDLVNIFEECKKAETKNLVIEFTSTSKITFPGGGVAALIADDEDIERIKNRMQYQTIGPDKLNQLRHARMFPTLSALKEHMKKHSAILKPKFEIVLNAFRSELNDIATWTEPKGGYFISLTVMDGTAKKIHKLCLNAGLIITEAGATFPYHADPNDNNLRIAPSFPPESELKMASKILCLAVKLAAIEKLLDI